MRSILSYIPVVNWFVTNNDNNTTEQTPVEAVEVPEKPDPIEPVIQIPDSTEHKGVIMLYYECLNKTLFDQIDNLDSDLSEYLEEISSIKGMFKWAFGGDKMEKKIAMFEYTTKLVDIVVRVDNVRENNPNLIYGQIVEYETSPELHHRVLRRLKHNQGVRQLMRLLYIVKWNIRIKLVDNWEEIVTVSFDDPALMTVTKKVDKLVLYVKYMNKDRECIHKGIEFRKKHYIALGQDKTTNHLNKEFIMDFNVMMKDFVVYFKLYDEFRKSLNWLEERRFHEYKETLPDFPTLNFGAYTKSKRIYSPCP